MTQFLPPNLLALFAARDPIPFLPPPAPLSHERRTTGYTGVGEYLKYFETGDPPIPPKYETREERHERKRKEKKEQVTYKLEQEIAMWNPAENERATTDPKKTLFVGRINFDTTESKLKREFEQFGKIAKVVMVKDKKTSKPRGYAFVEFDRETSMHAAFHQADGMKIDGKRVLVDFERAREEKTWLPRRLGGGLGGTRRGGPDMNIKISGREDPDRDRFRGSDGGRRRDRRERSRSVDSGRRRDRSRDRKPERVDRRRSRDRSVRLDRDRDSDKKDSDRDRKRSRRDEKDKSRKRSKSHDRKRHRSRSKDKDRKRDRKDKDRGDRDKNRDRDRKDRDRTIKTESDGDGPPQIKIKEEPKDDYPSYDDDFGYPTNHIKQEEDDDEPNNHNNNHSNEY